MLKMEKWKKFMNQLWNRENADYSAMVEQIPFNGIFCHSDISELLDMAKPHCLNSVLKLGFFVTGVFDYLMQWLMLFKSCHLAPLCWETAKFEIIRYIFDRFGTQTKVWSQSCKTHISSKRKNTNLKQKTEMVVICVQTIFLQRKTL